MRINSLDLNSYRVISELSIGREEKLPDTVLVFGENGSGKSSLLELIAVVLNNWLGRGSRFSNRNLDPGSLQLSIELTENEADFCFQGQQRLSREFQIDHSWNQNNINFKPSVRLGNIISEKRKQGEDITRLGTVEYLPAERTINSVIFNNLQPIFSRDDSFNPLINFGDRSQYFSKYQNLLRQWGTLLHEDIMKKSSYVDSLIETSKKQSDLRGRDIDSEIESIKENFNYIRVHEAINRYLPEIKLADISIQKDMPPTLVLTTYTGRDLAIKDLSSGERQIISWIIDLTHRKISNSIILWDEPGLHIHPSLMQKIPQIIKDLCPNSQLWIATHSPFILTGTSDNYLTVLLRGSRQNPLVGTDAHYQGLRKLTPRNFFAAFGKPILFVEGEDDQKMMIKLVKEHGLPFSITPMAGKPGLSRLNNILNDINDKWNRPMAIAVVDRDYYSDFSTDNYPFVRVYSKQSTDLEGLLLEPRYLNKEWFKELAEEKLAKNGISVSEDPVKQLVEEAVNQSTNIELLRKKYIINKIRQDMKEVLKNANPIDLRKDLANKLTSYAGSTIQSFDFGSLSLEYPEILQWAKGKLILRFIASYINDSVDDLTSKLRPGFIKQPPSELIEFLRIKAEEFIHDD